ncbi:MAG TPA: lipid-A-disaccharide synthase [Deltaproteobacteria bacterium]|nr:lipid-A-disaccharide synthase [Deltaproteobacteria bacterium]
MTTILLSAGDLSGERHAADLVHALRERMPGTRFVGMGGGAMAASGVELRVDQQELAVGGVFEVLRSLPRVASAWRAMRRCVSETRPDLVILVDSGGFNLPFARWLRRHSDAKILYYVAPQVWAWRPGRLRRLAARTDRIAVILPFEAAFYERHGVEVDFVGHPLFDHPDPGAGPGPAVDPASARASLGIPDHLGEGPFLGVFPGSRRNELDRHLPLQLDAFLRLRASEPGLGSLQALVGVAPNLDPDLARDVAGRRLEAAPDAIRFVHADDGRVLDACDVAVAKPGTITVELMQRHKPMVVIGRVHPLSAMIARRSLRVRWLSMPNLIAGAEIVPELLQHEATPDRITAALAPLFRSDGVARGRQVEALSRACLALEGPGAARRTAAIAEELLDTDPA